MLELRINKTGDGYSFSVIREDMVSFYEEKLPIDLEDEAQALIDYANSLKTPQEQATEEATQYIVDNADEETLLSMKALFQEWHEGMSLEPKKIIQYDGMLYEVIQAHTTQSDWLPPNVPALFKRIGSSDEPIDKVREFVQPTDSHDSYKTGDKIIFESKTYESLIDNNVWSPTAYPTGWKEVTE